MNDLHAALVAHWMLLRFLKLVAVAAFVTGSLGGVLVADARARELLASRVAPAGFTATWLVGALYAWAQGRALMTSWIVVAAILSFFVITASVALATRPRRPPMVARIAVAALLVACFAVMVWKP